MTHTDNLIFFKSKLTYTVELFDHFISPENFSQAFEETVGSQDEFIFNSYESAFEFMSRMIENNETKYVHGFINLICYRYDLETKSLVYRDGILIIAEARLNDTGDDTADITDTENKVVINFNSGGLKS